MNSKNIKTIFLIALVFILSSCERDLEEKNVKYYISGLEENFEISYINKSGTTITKQIYPQNNDASWQYNFKADEGDILYMYLKYTDTDVNPNKFKFRILIDGKVFKDAYGYDRSEGDSIFYIKRAGTVAF